MEPSMLKNLQKKMEADMNEKTQRQREEKAKNLEVSPALLKYLEAFEERLDTLEQKIEKLYAVRD